MVFFRYAEIAKWKYFNSNGLAIAALQPGGIASAMKQAMNDYTNRDKTNYGNTDIKSAAYPKFLEKLSVCQQVFHGFDYSGFMGGNDLVWAKMIADAVNFIIAPARDKEKKDFIKEADAHVDNEKGALVCSTVDADSWFSGNILMGKGIYHSYDYSFYYYNIRQNAADRAIKFQNNAG